MPYLITGATGAVGTQVVSQLRASGAAVRIVTRDPRKAPAGVEVAPGDFTAGDLPAAAFDGVTRVFLFPAQGGVRAFLELARRHGVERLVVLSSLAAAMEYERDRDSWSALHHRAVEDDVAASGIPATILRPGTFANNLLFWAPAIRTGDTVHEPYGQSAQTPIHEADIAAVAVAALTQDGHQGKTYPITGPQVLTRVAQLETIGAAIGRRLRHQEVPPEAFAQELSRYMPPLIVNMLLRYWSDTVKEPDVVFPTVEQVTGRPARTLAEWAKDHAADFAAPAAPAVADAPGLEAR